MRRLSDWQRVFAQATQASALPRQALRKLFAGQPLILMPRTDGNRRYYEFSGRISLGKLLAGIAGIIDPTTVASLTPASWNHGRMARLAGWASTRFLTLGFAQPPRPGRTA